MIVKDLLNKGIEELNNYNIPEASLKSRLLLSYILEIPKDNLILYYQDNVNNNIRELYLKHIEELCNKIPLQYITHTQEFMKINFYVDENVLIPQPDTESLVEEVLKLAKDDMKVLDMCTGSGAIAIALSKYGNNLKVSASDISGKALDIAKRNCLDNNIKNLVFIQSDIFENISDKYDIIVSNPPYIETEVLKTLDEEVKHEPLIALDGGKDGLYFYNKIIGEAKNYLNLGGYLCLEIGYNQKESVTSILKENGYINIKCITDIAGNNRVIIGEVE